MQRLEIGLIGVRVIGELVKDMGEEEGFCFDEVLGKGEFSEGKGGVGELGVEGVGLLVIVDSCFMVIKTGMVDDA